MDCNSPALARGNVDIPIEYVERDVLFSQALGEGEPTQPRADNKHMRFRALGSHFEMLDVALPQDELRYMK